MRASIRTENASFSNRGVCSRTSSRLMTAVVLALVGGWVSLADAALDREPYLQNLSGTAVTICWRTTTLEDSRVRWGTSPGSLTNEVSNLEPVLDHALRVTGLTPGETYYYSVGSSTSVLAGGDGDHYVHTAPPVGSSKPFTAWVIGDSGSGNASQYAVRDRMLAYMSGVAPDLVLHVGDIAYPWGTTANYTNYYFGVYADILRNRVSWPTIGNHDAGYSFPDTETGPYYDAYALPTAGESGGLASGTESYYSFDYGNVHFIVLDSQFSDRSPSGPMATWLIDDLAATSQDWVVAFWHHPPYTHGSHNSDNAADSGARHQDMRENILAILEAGGVDLVLTGHSHVYERSYLIDQVYCPACGPAPDYATPSYASLLADGHILDTGDGSPAGDGAYAKSRGLNLHEGAVYVVAGHAGGDRLALIDLHPVMRTAEAIAGSVVLEFHGSSVTAVNIRETGVVSDTFTIVKAAQSCGADSDCDDANPCTDDTCNVGACAYTPNTASCSDGNVCNGVEVCDGSGACVIATPPPDCSDANACTVDTCDPNTGCASVPLTQAMCRNAAKTQIMIVDKADDTKDKLKFTWSQGDESLLPAFGDPRYATDYALCVFDDRSNVAVEWARLSVGRSALFTPVGDKGWSYKDKTAATDGILKMKLLAGTAGAAKLSVLAKGTALPLPTPYSADAMLAADPKVGVGLVASNGECWKAVFDASSTRKNTALLFKAKN